MKFQASASVALTWEDPAADRRQRVIGAAVATGVVIGAFVIFLLGGRQYDAGRPDFFYLADAFVHGRVWLLRALGPYDVVVGPAGQVYVPFGPFPAFLLVPLVALVGPVQASIWQPIVNSALAAVDVGLAYWLAARAGIPTRGTRLWIAILLGFSTAIWWVTTRGGVWHTGHLVATLLTLCALIEAMGRRRPWLLGLLGGAAFLTRAPMRWSSIGRPPVHRGGTRERGPSAAGWRSVWASCRAWRSSSGTTGSGSGARSNRATRWPPCRTGSSPCGPRACSRQLTSG